MDALALGRYLRETRETKELTLEDAEATLHIRRRILEAFELGDFTVSGVSDVQVRGSFVIMPVSSDLMKIV